MHSFAVKVGNRGYHVCRITSWKNVRITQQHNYKLQHMLLISCRKISPISEKWKTMTFNTQPFEFQQDHPIDCEEEYLVAEVDSATKVTE